MNMRVPKCTMRGSFVWLFIVVLLQLCTVSQSLNMITDCTGETLANPICSNPDEICDFAAAGGPKCICNTGFFPAIGGDGITNDQCYPCAAGKYKPQEGAGYAVDGIASCQATECCLDCPAGRFMLTNALQQTNTGAKFLSQCQECNAAQYGNFAGTGILYTSLPGALSVEPCIGEKCWDDVCFYSPTGQPTMQPTSQPTTQPSGQPTGQPTTQPSERPSTQPTASPSGQPSGHPTSQPSTQPTMKPTGQPSSRPTCPTGQPTSQPTCLPTGQPTGEPTSPTGQPTGIPTGQPSIEPTSQPSGQPSIRPTCIPTGQPTVVPSRVPTGQPSGQPIGAPTSFPSGQPTSKPTQLPSGQPTSAPSGTPTSLPTSTPEADVGGVKVTLCFAGFWLFFLISALFREYQQSKRLLIEKKGLLKSSSVKPDASRPNSTGSGKNGRTIHSRGGGDTPGAASDVEAPRERDPRDVVKDLLRVSLARIFEGVFSKESNRIKKLEFEIEHNHAYLMLLWSRKVGVRRWINALKLLTSLSIAALSICLVYDYHFPSNDGGCYKHLEESSCAKPRLGFDSSKFQCRWQLERVTGYTSTVPAMCTFNNSDDVYEMSFFLHVVLFVLLGMGIVNLVLDLIFEHIIGAPATTKTVDVAVELARDSIRLKYHKKVQAQLIRLNKGIITHRDELLAAGRIDELDEFDAQWGINLTIDGSEEIIWMDKISADLYEVIQDSQELRIKLESQSEIQCGTELLYLFAKDLMGRNTPAARIFANKTEQAVKGTHRKISIYIKLFFVLAIIIGDGLILMFMLNATRHKLENWMSWVGYGFLCYVILDIFSIEGSKIAWVHFMVPNAVSTNAIMAHNIIEQTLDDMCADNIDDDMDMGGVPIQKSKFSASDHLYISTRVAKHFPGLFESAVILSYRESLPNASGFYWGQDTLHSLRSKQGWNHANNSSVKPTMGTSNRTNTPSSQLENLRNHGLRDSLQKKVIQDVMMNGDESESLSQYVYRVLLWFILELFSNLSIELQKFIVHIAQPVILYGVMQLCFLVLEYITIGFYVIVILSLILAVIFVLHLSHESSEIGALEEEEEEEQIGSMDGGYSEVEFAVSPGGDPGSRKEVQKKRSASFDSEDDDTHAEGYSSLAAALKTESIVKKMYLNSTPSTSASPPKVVNLRSNIQNAKNAVFNAPSKTSKSIFEQHLDRHEAREDAEFASKNTALSKAKNPFLQRLSSLQPVSFVDPKIDVIEDIEVRNAESSSSHFYHENDDTRYSRSSHEMEKAIEKRLGYGKKSNDNVPSTYNSEQLDPSANFKSIDKKSVGLDDLLKNHSAEEERELGKAANNSPSNKFKRAVVRHVSGDK